MANRLSHSSINRFLTCGESWRLHYKEGYRPVELSSALPFGSAFGKACEFILNPESFDHPANNVLSGEKVTPSDVFDYHWNYADINGILTSVRQYPNMVYSKYDIDWDLITAQERSDARGDPNIQAWYSLRHKAHLMLKTFQEELLPKIKKVYSTEEKIELGNEEGDSSIGYADAVIDLEGYPTPVILDFKTAAREYEEDSVRTSVQLSQYLHILSDKYNTRLAGYAVFLKQIEKNRIKICSDCKFKGEGSHKTCNNTVKGKRCGGEWKETLNPKAKMQLIVDEIPLMVENLIIDNIENVNNAIKSQIFVKNVNSCFDNGWGRPCEFQKKCWENNENGLVKVKLKK